MIGILTAVYNEKLFILQERHTREELLQLRSSSRFFCPGCNHPVILKVGTSKIPHFAHLQKSSCSTASEPETVLHLLGKSRLHTFFQHRNLSPKLEPYLGEIQQRPDILVNRRAIEFQCSALSAEQVAVRSEGYRSIDLEPLWIRGTKQIPLPGTGIFNIRSFERQMFCGTAHAPYLLYFHPDQSRFIYISNLFYLHGNQWAGKASLLEMRQQSYPFAVPKLMDRKEYQLTAALFRIEKKKFIHSQLFAKNRMQNPFWRLSYELQLDKEAIPEIYGLPMAGGHFINEHPLIWQMKVALMVRSKKRPAALLEQGMIKCVRDQPEEDILRLLSNYEKLLKINDSHTAAKVEDLSYQMLAKGWEN